MLKALTSATLTGCLMPGAAAHPSHSADFRFNSPAPGCAAACTRLDHSSEDIAKSHLNSAHM